MTTNDDHTADDEVEPPQELDAGLAFAYGEDSAEAPSPSVLERLVETSGVTPRIALRDLEPAGDTPMLKPLGPDDRIDAGKYVVHGELGRGGVGAVHRGHDQDLGRDVAMKFLHDKYKDEPSILHRFVEEAQIGGQLQHPGIVPVYDLGMVDGTPFFAMKLVKGQTLAKKLAERASPDEDRGGFLGIFEDVCQTLAYAHARGVVHRDLKPANIMIGSFGEVQVVDWGMGKVLPQGGVADEKRAVVRQDDESVIQTVRSEGSGAQSIAGSVMGTPAYMPPEQARGEVDVMDERSDVFALGAILCEILTGRPPYVAESTADLVGMAALAQQDDAHARLAACDADPELVELATRCLMPAPAARPRSAEVVAKAVHEHLAAVEARVHEARVEAAEARVRAAALRRNQAYGIGLTVVIAAGLIVSLWFWRAAETAATDERLAREAAVTAAANERLARAAAVASAEDAREKERLAVEQTEVAQRELARAVEIKGLITGMLSSIDPEEARGADVTLLRGILDSASQRLAEGAIEDELVAAELHTLVGQTYVSIGHFPEAGRHLHDALEIHQRMLGDEDVVTLTSMTSLAFLHEEQGRLRDAESLLVRALDGMRRVHGEDHKGTQVATVNLAMILSAQGRYAEAEQLFVGALDIQRRDLGLEDRATRVTMGHLASVLGAQGRGAEAEALLLEKLEAERRLLGEEDRATLGTMHNLSTFYAERGLQAEAEELLLRAYEIQQRVLGEEHPDTLTCMASLGALYGQQGRYAEAEPYIQRAFKVTKRVHGAESPRTLISGGLLANVYATQGRDDEAEALYLEVLEGLERVLGEDHPRTLVTINNLAALYVRLGRYADAAARTESILPRRQRRLGPAASYIWNELVNLETAYAALGRHDDLLRVRRALLDLDLGPADAADASASTLNAAAWTLLTHEFEELHDPERALAFAERACSLGEATDHGFLWGFLDTLALAQHRTGDTAAAVETQRRAIALMPVGAEAVGELEQHLAEYEAALRDG